MIDVLKGTWIYKLKAADDRDVQGEFGVRDIKEVVYEEERNVPSILIRLKDGTQRLSHPSELNMQELEALTTWAENFKGSK